jgi:hypothetical protein
MAKKANTKLPANSKVTLKVKGENGKEQKFEIGHALRLLRLPNSGWEINDSKYTFSGNDIKRNPSKGSDSSAEK